MILFNPVQELSERTQSLDKIDSVIEELEQRQRWLVKYIALKNNEHQAFGEQTKLQFGAIQRQLDQAIAMVAEQQALVEEKRAAVVDCTQRLYELDREKRDVLRLAGELERVELLKQAVALLEQSIFDPRHFEKASEALGMIGELQDNLARCEHAAVWIDKAQQTVPKVLKAASEYFKECLLHNRTPGLRSACKVIDASPEVRSRMVEWCAVHFLSDYEAVYSAGHGEPELVRLCSLDSRLHWFNRTLAAVDQCAIPKEWRIEEAIAGRFGALTRHALAKAVDHEDPKSIHSNLRASIKTVRSYEQYLQATRPGLFSDDRPAHHFLMPAFLPHMHVFVEQQERALAQFMSGLSQEAAQKRPKRGTSTTTRSVAHDAKRYYALSGEQLLLMFRNGLNEIAALSTGAVLGDLAAVFGGSLREYHRYLASLLAQLSKRCDGVTVETAGVLICTADYMIDAVKAMQIAFRNKLDRTCRVQVDFSPIVQCYEQFMNSVVGRMAEVLLSATEAAWEELRQEDLGRLASCADQSKYMSTLITDLTCPAFSILRTVLKENVPERHRWVCEAFASCLISKLESSLGKCKPIGTVAAEQILMDLQSLRPVLLGLNPTEQYRALVERQLQPLERTCKILLHDAVDAESFVAHYYLMSDGDGREESFRKVLELKGIGRGATSTALTPIAGTLAARERYAEAFRRHQPPPPTHIAPTSATGQQDSHPPRRSLSTSFKHKFMEFFN